jgi:hypothetical protein
MKIKFSAKKVGNRGDAVEVRYDCSCGCHPAAVVVRGSNEAGHEHCCCGIVHFAGPSAESKLRGYLDARKADGSDAPDAAYAVSTAAVRAPWGSPVEVAYAVPVAR